MARRVSDDTPLLVLVHGTGKQAHDEDEVYLDPLNYDALAKPGKSDSGERWWQSEGAFAQALAARIHTRDGHALTDRGAVYRLKWSGANAESARDAGADSFVHLFRGCRPRRVHVIAHSHGGNVVRTGVERLAREGADLCRLGAVVSMGTPFFTYSWGQVLKSVAWTAGAGVLLAVLSWLGGASLYTTESAWWQWLVIPGTTMSGLLAIVLLASALSSAARPTKGRSLPRGPKVAWTNLCSRNDEAVQLLRSFEGNVTMFARSGKRADAGLVWLALVFALFVTLEMAVVGGTAALGWTEGWVGFLAAAIAAGLTYLVARAGWEVRIWGGTAGGRWLDGKVTQRLRALAYGDDVGAGMAGVRTLPWNDGGSQCRALPEDVEAAIEAHVAQTSAGLWSRARRAIQPNASFLNANFRYLIDEVLTGDELAHTVYYRIDALVDMVADLLVESGDYVRVQPAMTLPAAS